MSTLAAPRAAHGRRFGLRAFADGVRFAAWTEPSEPQETALHCTGSGKVLVVDDDRSVRKLAARMLAEAGYAVLEASSAKAALELIRREGPFDLLLTDVVLPGQNGRELAGRVALLQPGVAVLYMSGHADHDVSACGVVGRGERFLAKPFGRNALLERVAALVDRAPPEPWRLRRTAT